MMKRALCWIIVCLLLVPCSTFATEYPQDPFPHDEFLGRVLLGRNYDSKKDAEALKMLQYASYLAIDQFNNNNESKASGDQEKLDWLRRDCHVSGLPKSVNEINPPSDGSTTQLSAKNHRTYTHRGWLFPYKNHEKGDLAYSDVRNAILKNTVIKVFNFRLKPPGEVGNWLKRAFAISFDDAKCNAVCQLIYYIHILGDCYEDDNYYKANGSNNGFKIPLGRKTPGNTIEDTSIIEELIKIMPDLFADQQSTWMYSTFMKELAARRNEIRALYGKTGGINSTERYEEYHKQAKKLMDVLELYVPRLLQNEKYFSKVFYK